MNTRKMTVVTLFLLFIIMTLSACSNDPRTAQGASLPTATPTPTAVPLSSTAQASLNQQQTENDRLEAENKELRDQIDDLLEDNADLQAEIQDLQDDNEELRDQIAEANRKLDRIISQMEADDSEPTASATPQPQGNDVEESETADAPSNENDTSGVKPTECTFSTPGNIDNMPKSIIEMFSEGAWTHRVFNERLFNAQNNWGGADSWFVTLALGANSGGAWTDMGNPGQIIYRGTSTHLSWCLGVLTTSKHKDEFMVGQSGDAAINVRITPDTPVLVTGPGGSFPGLTSDAGDITIILPENGVVTIAVDYSTAAPTHESHVWWGPYDRSENINTIDPR